MAGMIEGSASENLLWNIERIITMIFIPILNANCISDKGETLSHKIKKDLLPCLRSFTSSLRVAEEIVGGGAGLLIREFPREAYTIKTLEDSLSFLNSPDGLERYKHVHAVS